MLNKLGFKLEAIVVYVLSKALMQDFKNSRSHVIWNKQSSPVEMLGLVGQ